MVQWLRPCTPSAERACSIPGWGTEILTFHTAKSRKVANQQHSFISQGTIKEEQTENETKETNKQKDYK